MKIYTKTGDRGETGLVGGARIKKSSYRIAAVGDIDELQSFVGLARSLKRASGRDSLLRDIQIDLFYAGADVTTPLSSTTKARRISKEDVEKLEKAIDEIDVGLPRLTNFILPEGTQFACCLHVARSVCRRAERTVVQLEEKEEINPQVKIYLNRLSDLLFVLAREDSLKSGEKEEKWTPE